MGAAPGFVRALRQRARASPLLRRPGQCIVVQVVGSGARDSAYLVRVRVRARVRVRVGVGVRVGVRVGVGVGARQRVTW